MKPPILLLTIVGSLALAPPQAFAEPQWTFCVASAPGTSDVWITEVFAAPVDRERLETELKSVLARQGHARVDVQCPQPSADKVAAVNAQTTAEQFNRRLGSVLHDMSASDFPPRQ
jgi:hypothetical protein